MLRAGGLGLAALVALGAGAAWANVFAEDGVDPRVPQERDAGENPYSAIGRITTAEAVWDDNLRQKHRVESTAFMVSPCYAMATFHGVFGDLRAEPNLETHDIIFEFKLAEADPDLITSARPILHGGFIAHNALNGNDWVLLEVQGCPGDLTGWANLSTERETKASFALAGYPGDLGPERLWIHRGCRMGDYHPPSFAIEHYCAANPGQSGAPIFVEEAAGPLTVIAMNRGHRLATAGVLPEHSPATSNMAVPVANFLYRIQPYLDQDIEEFGQPNPARRAGP